jgi:segregation and condensation protein A
MIDSYVIKTDNFEGPLDLLLNLIEKRKLFINEISLAEVTGDYISYMNEGRDTLDNIADFIAIASTLLLIKSRSLLPSIDLTHEETGNIEDLNLRLHEYQEIKERAKLVEEMFDQRPIYEPLVRQNNDIIFAPSEDMNITSLLEAIQSVLDSLPVQKEWPKAIVEKVVSLEEVLNSLTHRISRGVRMSFNDFSGKGKESRVHVIVHFIALLELVKQGVIDARHDENNDIIVETDHVGVPDYQ